MEQEAVRELITEIFEEEALLLGGVVALSHLDDGVVWRLARGLDRLRRRFLKRIDETEVPVAGEEPRAVSTKAHPAIEQLLRSIREDAPGVRTVGAS